MAEGIVRIIAWTARMFGVKPRDIWGVSRKQPIAHARHVAIYISHVAYPALSSIKMGQEFGGKDHSTILHSYQRVKILAADDAAFREKVLALLVRLDELPGVNVCEYEPPFRPSWDPPFDVVSLEGGTPVVAADAIDDAVFELSTDVDALFRVAFRGHESPSDRRGIA